MDLTYQHGPSAGRFVQTYPAIGLTERAATRVIDLLLERPISEDGGKGRSSPDSVILPLGTGGATPPVSPPVSRSVSPPVSPPVPLPPDMGKEAAGHENPDSYHLRSSRLAPLAAATGARPQPFLPIGATRTMSREQLETRRGVRQLPTRSLAPLTPDDPRLAQSRRYEQGSAAWAAAPPQSSTQRLMATRSAPR